MKLQDRLPDGVKVGKRYYKMDFDFRNVLRMIEELDRDDLLDEAREWRALKCVCKHPRNVHAVLDEVRKVLFRSARREKAQKGSGQKVTDYEQDAELIRAAFLQAYGINLWTDRVHWLVFSELLNAIPEGSRYAEVIGIRVRPMPEATKWNLKERQWLAKAKADLAIQVSEKEQARRYDQDVMNIANVLMGIAKGSETNV